MADEPSLNFKFSLDLSDFDKAPKIIDDALQHIASQAEAQGKNADMAMSKWVQDMIKERESRVAELTKQIEDATRAYAETFANFQNGNATYEEWEKSYEALSKLKDELSQTKDELTLLNEKENEVAGNASFMTQLKMKAQGLDLYGKAMSMLPAPIANVIKSTSSLNKALLALTTNPIVMMIAGLVMAIKALYGWFDGLADRSDGVAYAFGVVSGAIDKVLSAIKELINLNLDGFLYNIKTMFDGGEREVAKRNEDLRRVEEQGLRDRLQRDNQFLRRRMSNTKLDMKDRLEAEKQYTANLKQIEETRRAELERKMTEWSKKNGLRTAENPEGWATDISQLSGPLQVELQEMYNEMARIDNAMADITEESKDRLVKMREQVHSEFEANMKWLDDQVKARKQYQRQVREALEAEAERLQTMSTQTENMVIQSQIKEMADGIEKVTKEAQFKTKQAYEALDKTLVDEAKKLYNNEKAIYEGNPANEGKMFKAFKLDDYVRQARQNIGYNLRKELISNEEMQTMKKAVDKLVKDTTDNIKKSTNEASDALTKLRESMEVKKDDNLFTSIKSEVIAYQKALTSFKNTYDEASESERELAELQKERIMLQIQLNEAEDPKEKEKIAEAIKKNIDKSNEASQKAIGIADKLKKKQEDVKKTIEDQRQALIGYLGQITSVFKGISEDADKAMEMTSQMLDAMKSIASGNYIEGAVKVMTMMLEKITDSIKRRKKMEEERMEKEKESLKAQSDAMRALAQSAFDYKLALLDAKKAQDALYNTTNIQSMLDAQKKLNDAQKMYLEYGDTLTSGSGLRNRGTWRGLEGFVNSVNSTVIGGARAIREGAIKHFADTLEAPLFKLNEKGVYEVDKEVWESIKSSGDAISVLNEAQQQTIENLIALQDKIAEAQEEMAGSIAEWYAPLLDNMTDAMMDWLTTNEDIMDKFREYSSDTFRQIVKDLIKNMLYKDLFANYTEQIESMTKEYLNTGNEQNYAQAIASVTNSLMEDMEYAKAKSKAIWDAWESSMNEIGIDMNETTGRNAEARGIARASQESVDENNARLAMMQQHTYTINANVAQLVSYSASALEHLSAIHSNTNRLERIEGLLSDINTYGVRTR